MASAAEVLDMSFEEMAHILGGFLAAERVSAAAGWKLAGEVAGVWCRARGRIGGAPDHDRLHPGIVGLLAMVRAHGNTPPTGGPGRA